MRDMSGSCVEGAVRGLSTGVCIGMNPTERTQMIDILKRLEVLEARTSGISTVGTRVSP